jgi:hypothetical protein
MVPILGKTPPPVRTVDKPKLNNEKKTKSSQKP